MLFYVFSCRELNFKLGYNQHSMSSDPLILTLRPDVESLAYFTKLRQTYFPADRNYLDAHITLFHQLPSSERAKICADLKQAANRAVFLLKTEGLMFLGKGVAFRFSSSEAGDLRRDLAERWHDHLVPQDQKKTFQPHITVQNKVGPEEAKVLFDRLEKTAKDRDIRATGLDLWYYRGGPWEHIEHFAFAADGF